MNIRALDVSDIPTLRVIHERYFAKEFEFPDFLNGFYCAFVAENDDNEIVVAGGIRPIPEAIMITDLSKSAKDRKLAFCNILQASEFTCAKFGFNELHAFIQHDEWYKHFHKVGFNPTKGDALVLKF